MHLVCRWAAISLTKETKLCDPGGRQGNSMAEVVSRRKHTHQCLASKSPGSSLQSGPHVHQLAQRRGSPLRLKCRMRSVISERSPKAEIRSTNGVTDHTSNTQCYTVTCSIHPFGQPLLCTDIGMLCSLITLSSVKQQYACLYRLVSDKHDTPTVTCRLVRGSGVGVMRTRLIRHRTPLARRWRSVRSSYDEALCTKAEDIIPSGPLGAAVSE